jgi:hypothetical protein
VTGELLSVRFAGLRRRRPPRSELHFDVTLRSEGGGPGWACLPTALRPGSSPPPRRTGHTVDIYELRGTGRVAVARFLGEDGFAGLLTPGRAELALMSFPVEYWGEPPDHADFELVTARALLLDGRPLEDLVALDLLCDREAEVDATPLEDQRAVVESLGGGPTTRLTAELVDLRTTACRVELDGAEHRPSGL